MAEPGEARRTAARRVATWVLLAGCALPFVLGLVAAGWLTLQGRPVARPLDGLVMILLPTILLVVPVYALLARKAYLWTLQSGEDHARTPGLWGAFGGLTLACGVMLFALLLEGQVSMLALLVLPFWMACAAGALVGYWAERWLARLSRRT